MNQRTDVSCRGAGYRGAGYRGGGCCGGGYRVAGCWIGVLLFAVIASGCRKADNAPVPPTPGSEQPAPATAKVAEQSVELVPQSYEAGADELLAARLSQDEASAGWIRLFDGHTLFGWEIAGAANWRVENGCIVVDDGENCLLCTSLPWQDFELTVEFKAGANTNSGVFLRTPLDPENPEIDCYEVNIAPDDNPFPTANIVNRWKSEVASAQDFDTWRTMKMVLQGNRLQVSLDDQLVSDYTDPVGLSPGRIGLQHNQGRVEFRNIKLRPLGLKSLLDADLTQWKKYPEMPGNFSSTEEGWLHVQGGSAQLETKESYDDFVLLAEYKLPTAEMNSGIFFRCIPGDTMMGYECQLSNEISDGNRLTPADCGTGGIFRRQNARVVAGDVDKWATVVLVAHQASMAAWVNGVQVSNWMDDRPTNKNPRRGQRLEAGTIMIQGHDPSTDALLKQIAITPIRNALMADGGSPVP